jgi:hypothetical protein
MPGHTGVSRMTTTPQLVTMANAIKFLADRQPRCRIRCADRNYCDSPRWAFCMRGSAAGLSAACWRATMGQGVSGWPKQSDHMSWSWLARTPKRGPGCLSQQRRKGWPLAGGHADLSSVLRALVKQYQVRLVRVGVGGRLNGALLGAGPADEIGVFVAHVPRVRAV